MSCEISTTSIRLRLFDVVDISQDIIELSDQLYGTGPEHPLRDPRVHVHIEDGRQFLQSTERRFDLITGEPPPPVLAGVVNLYSREFFALAFDRLEPGGMITYWLPLHALSDISAKAIIRGFCDVYADCSLWNGSAIDLMLVGTKNANGPVTREHFERQWSDPVVAPELHRLAFEVPEQLGALFVGDSSYLNDLTRDSAPLVDDFPNLITADASSQEALAALWAVLRDADGARARFEKSPLIERLWPRSLALDSVRFFEFQQMINGITYGDSWTSWSARFGGAQTILERSPLAQPLLWLLASTSDHMRVVESLSDEDREHPEMQIQQGIQRLAHRDYTGAIDFFVAAERHRSTMERAAAMHLFSLCMAGEIKLARSTATHLYPGMRKSDETADYWRWMDRTFGIDPAGDLKRRIPTQTAPESTARPIHE